MDISDGELITQSSWDYINEQNLDGQLADGTPETKRRYSEDYNQLDEPILDTLKRDLYSIYNKTKIIALPLSSYDIYKVVLRGWDLWGPLILCTFLAFNLHHSNSTDNQSGPHFSDVFVLVWFGSCLVSLNYRLLSISSIHSNSIVLAKSESRQEIGQHKIQDMTAEPETKMSQVTPHRTLVAPPSIFQLMCVFGYSLVSPCFGLILLKIFSFEKLIFERIIVGSLFGFAWPTVCSVRILIRYQHPSKRALAIYPIGLYYLVINCLIILNH